MKIQRTRQHIDFVDLFAGPGGATMGGVALGLRDLGIEWDDSACATRRAAGLGTLQGDVSLLDPAKYVGVKGLWASPPCQGFSKAGLQRGLGDSARILEHIIAVDKADAWFKPEVQEWDDHRSELVLEPLRWVDQMEPEWTVWEQVPFVLPIWEACAAVLQDWGYHVWVGKVWAEQYGVPQCRERAILIASRTHTVGRPKPTHSRYHPRTPEKIDDGVLRPVTMAEGLGWGMTKRPYPAVAPGTSGGGTDPLAVGGSGARKIVYGAHAAGDWLPQVMEPVDGLPRVADQSGTKVDLLWPAKRPSTVLPGRNMVQHPGATANRYNGSTKSRNDGFRLTVQEGGMLQSFAADYPWQGKKGKMWEQVGNVVPPLLAKACLAEAMGL
jgi:DNA (cytosine-5)-methyltransferase 1